MLTKGPCSTKTDNPEPDLQCFRQHQLTDFLQHRNRLTGDRSPGAKNVLSGHPTCCFCFRRKEFFITSGQPVASSLGAKIMWQPTAGMTWQIELSGAVSNLTHPADVFGVDLYDTPATTIKALKGQYQENCLLFLCGEFRGLTLRQSFIRCIS
jgi:hypothetical protein